MRAEQSSSAAGFGSSSVWGRSEQFAALRYVSRSLETDAAVGPSFDSYSRASPEVEGGAARGGAGWAWAAWDTSSQIGSEPLGESATEAEMSAFARDAWALLEAMRFCNGRVADQTISFAEWSQYSKELAWLRNRSWELMEQFVRGARRPLRPGPERSCGARPEGKTPGRIAC